ncbi:MAG: tyrosine--tRNA ligase [Desulfobacteria bacterium]
MGFLRDHQQWRGSLKNVFDILKKRGFIEQTTDDKAVRLLFERPVTCYVGFDPTASSLHVGSLIPIMSLAHMQRQGHRPIALVGGGTGLVGDPSGKTELRQMLTLEDVKENAEGIRKQLAAFIDFEEGALLVNNADWLTELNYIRFLREIGRHFSVNRMLAAESYKMRMQTGLNFIEFNYMLLQAYDFLHMYEKYACKLQMGGSDQWGNILAGVDLIRRAGQGTAQGMTFPLITTSTGAKMGKTAQGAVWLDASRTSAYDYYQFWINTDDADVVRFLLLFTFLPIDEIEAVTDIEGSDLNAAKTILAFEATQLAHGEKEALKAFEGASGMFGRRSIDPELLPGSKIPRPITLNVQDLHHGHHLDHVHLAEKCDPSLVPTTVVEPDRLKEGIPAFKLFHEVGLCASGGAARRLIQQGGGYINGTRLDRFDHKITEGDIDEGVIILRAGKKQFHCIKVT